jgi:hypothetical protein
MKSVGTLRKTPWQRFVRLQRTARLLGGTQGQPKGVFKFRSYEEAEQWKMKSIVK